MTTLLFALGFKYLNNYEMPNLYWAIFFSGFANPKSKRGNDVQAKALKNLEKL